MVLGFLAVILGQLLDSMRMDMAGRVVKDPETIQPDSHAPNSSSPNLPNSAGILPDQTQMDAGAGNTLSYPEAMQAGLGIAISVLPSSTGTVDVGYGAESTDPQVDNNSMKAACL